MVELKNNGDALSCIVLMLDSLAYSNGSTVEIETLHDQECLIFAHMKKTLLVPFKLSEVVEYHPWLEDGDRTKKMIATAGEHGSDSPLMGKDFQALKLQFSERRGYNNPPSREEREELLPPELVELLKVDPNGTIH